MGAKLAFIVAGLITLAAVVLTSAYIVQESLMKKTPINEIASTRSPKTPSQQTQPANVTKESPAKGENSTAVGRDENGRRINVSSPPVKLNQTEGANVSEKWYPESISLNYKWVDEGLKVYLKIDLPDPCHKVRIIGTRAEAQEIAIYVEAESPPPHTYCIQVVPKPYRAEFLFEVPRGHYRIEIVVNGRRIREVLVRG